MQKKIAIFLGLLLILSFISIAEETDEETDSAPPIPQLVKREAKATARPVPVAASIRDRQRDRLNEAIENCQANFITDSINHLLFLLDI